MRDTWRVIPRSGGEFATIPTEHRACEITCRYQESRLRTQGLASWQRLFTIILALEKSCFTFRVSTQREREAIVGLSTVVQVRGKTTRKPGTALRWNHVRRNLNWSSCVEPVDQPSILVVAARRSDNISWFTVYIENIGYSIKYKAEINMVVLDSWHSIHF